MNLEPIIKAIDFIEAHLKAPLMVADIAEAVGYSVYHFCRTFNLAVHHTPYDYLMRRRLSESARELVGSDRKIIDVAYEYRFNNHETYSRAFRRMFDTQPSQVKKAGRIEPRVLMPRLTIAHIHHIHQGEYLKPLWEHWEHTQVTGIGSLVTGEQDK